MSTYSRILLRQNLIRSRVKLPRAHVKSVSIFTAARAQNVLFTHKTPTKIMRENRSAIIYKRSFITTSKLLDKTKSDNAQEIDEEDKGFSLDSGNLVVSKLQNCLNEYIVKVSPSDRSSNSSRNNSTLEGIYSIQGWHWTRTYRPAIGADDTCHDGWQSRGERRYVSGRWREFCSGQHCRMDLGQCYC